MATARPNSLLTSCCSSFLRFLTSVSGSNPKTRFYFATSSFNSDMCPIPFPPHHRLSNDLLPSDRRYAKKLEAQFVQ